MDALFCPLAIEWGDFGTWVAAVGTIIISVAAFRVSHKVYQLEAGRDGELQKSNRQRASTIAMMLAQELASVDTNLRIVGELTNPVRQGFNPRAGLKSYLVAQRRIGVPLLDRLVDQLHVMPPQVASKLGVVLMGVSMSTRNAVPPDAFNDVPDDLAETMCTLAHNESCALLLRVQDAWLAVIEVAKPVARVPGPERWPEWLSAYKAAAENANNAAEGGP